MDPVASSLPLVSSPVNPASSANKKAPPAPPPAATPDYKVELAAKRPEGKRNYSPDEIRARVAEHQNRFKKPKVSTDAATKEAARSQETLKLSPPTKGPVNANIAVEKEEARTKGDQVTKGEEFHQEVAAKKEESKKEEIPEALKVVKDNNPENEMTHEKLKTLVRAGSGPFSERERQVLSQILK